MTFLQANAMIRTNIKTPHSQIMPLIVKTKIKHLIFRLYFKTYTVLKHTPKWQQRLIYLVRNYPGFQKHLQARQERTLIFPYIPQNLDDLSSEARMIYQAFKQDHIS